MNRRLTILLFIALIPTLVCAAGCATKQRLSTQIETLNGQLAEIRQHGAPICAPKEYATAEANIDFAREEWGERDYMKCEDHLTIASENIEKARVWLASCVENVPPDRDGDGILDDTDKCPDEAEDADQFQDEDGCPDQDNDQDGVADAEDQCPTEAEDKDDFEDENGCPDTDNDKDGLADGEDNCPDAFGTPESKGCPQYIQVQGDKITLNQQIHFDSGRSVIKPDSYQILDEVAAVLKSNENWMVRVEGHTDNVGSREKNLQLSEERARACMDYIVNKGVAASRMSATGYGFDQPIASNATPDGRTANRRTEFKILSK